MSEVPNTNEIRAFCHCELCLREKPEDQSPSEWARLNAGMTPIGFQVWCVRHDVNVINIDFEGMKHPANATRYTEAGDFGRVNYELG